MQKNMFKILTTQNTIKCLEILKCYKNMLKCFKWLLKMLKMLLNPQLHKQAWMHTNLILLNNQQRNIYKEMHTLAAVSSSIWVCNKIILSSFSCNFSFKLVKRWSNSTFWPCLTSNSCFKLSRIPIYFFYMC